MFTFFASLGILRNDQACIYNNIGCLEKLFESKPVFAIHLYDESLLMTYVIV